MTRTITPHWRLLNITLITLTLTACGGSGEGNDTDDNRSAASTATTTANTTTTSTTTASTSATTGKALYAANCALCHGSNAAQNGNNVLRGANASAAILNAISNNKGGMGYLSGTIGSQQASDLAAFLATPTI
jgi:mono/diheme cytochrome c family protein